MRKYLLAGAALAVATAALPAVASAAEMPATVTIGGRIFESFFNQSVTNQNVAGGIQGQSYNMQSYFRLYPAVDYTAPNGIHYGFKSELRWDGNHGAGRINRAYLFVKSDKMGTLTVGGQAGAVKSASVANDEASGTGGWDGEYGFFGNGYRWLLADASGDGQEGVKYVTPSFSGLSATVSFIPNSANQVGANFVASSAPAGSTNATKNVIEGVLNYAGAFGGTGVNADIGLLSATPLASGLQNVNVMNVGLEVSMAGFTVGGNYQTGKFADGYGALAAGLKATKAYDAGVVYGFGAAQVGAQYYGYEIATSTTKTEKFSGEALGASYKLNPGVTFFFDGLVGQKTATAASKVNFTGIGVGTYFQW